MDAKPLTEEEERVWREVTGSCAEDQPSLLSGLPGWMAPWAVDRMFATLDAVRAEIAAARHEIISASEIAAVANTEAVRYMQERDALRVTNAKLNREKQAAYSQGGKDAIAGLARKRNNGRELERARADVAEQERDALRLTLEQVRERCEVECIGHIIPERDALRREVEAWRKWHAAWGASPEWHGDPNDEPLDPRMVEAWSEVVAIRAANEAREAAQNG